MLIDQETDAKVDQHGFFIMVDHDVLGFNVSMNDLDNVVTIMEGFEHVQEVDPELRWLQPFVLTILRPTVSQTRLIVLLELLIGLL